MGLDVAQVDGTVGDLGTGVETNEGNEVSDPVSRADKLAGPPASLVKLLSMEGVGIGSGFALRLRFL